MAARSFLSDLRRRKVVQAAAIYGAVAWGVTEVLVTVVEQLFLPQWVSTLVVIGFVVGFPVAMFLAWTFDITSEGIRRTEVTSRRGKASIMFSLLLLVAGTAGLFFLIRPALQEGEAAEAAVDILPNSVAVLPFQNVGGNPDNAYLSEGLSDELRDQLGRVSELRIAARSSSVAAAQQGLDARSTSAKLGVAHLIEGSLRQQAGRLRVSIQLIEGSTGLALWSETFDRGPKELLSVQQLIAERVVQLLFPDAATSIAEPATRNANANELMLLARHYEQQVRSQQNVDTETLLEAVRLYREATEADPESALAHSRLAGALLYLGDLEGAEAPIFKALALNPNLSEVQNTLGEFYWARGLPEARTAFARAVEINPNNADALNNYANLLWLSYEGGHSTDQQVALFRRALSLDRLSLARHAALGEFVGKEGKVDEVYQVIEDIRELFDGAESFRIIAWLKELIGKPDEAIAWVLRARDLEPDNPDHVEKLAELYASIGDFAVAVQLEPEPGLGLLFQMRRYADLIDVAEYLMIDEPNDMEVRYLLAFAYNATGKFESAIHVLSTTGLPDIMLNNTVRSVSDVEAFVTLMNALAGVGQGETVDLAQTLARWFQGSPTHGDIGWNAMYDACALAIQGRHDEALEMLEKIKEGLRLVREPLLRDMHCFSGYEDMAAYRDVLRHEEERRAALRERLPATLAEFGVSL